MNGTSRAENPTILGETNFRNRRRAFGIRRDDRRRHVYVVGKTGVGKSTLLGHSLIQDIQRGEGVALVDPHGELAESVLAYVPPSRINDVVYFDPGDAEFPVAFNVLETVGTSDPRFDQEKNLVSSGLVGVFKKLWAVSWGPRLEYILRNTILALIDSPGNTLLGIMRMLADKGFRRKIIEHIRDPVVKSFWVDEFAQYNERFRSEAISPIQNKVGQFLTSSTIRNIVGQATSTVDLGDAMNTGKIFIMNLSKGKIGEDNSALLGAMMITKIQLAAMGRALLPEEQRRDFYLYVDEFQNFATESFAGILSEARKYRLNLIMAHQYITQMSEEVRDAVFGNVGSLVCFRVGAFDAEFLEREYAPYFTETDLVNLDKYNAYIKLMIDGTSSKPFSMTTIPAGTGLPRYNDLEKIRNVSRERYGRPRAEVEEKIARWSGTVFRGAAEEESVAFRGREDARAFPRRGRPSPTTESLTNVVLTRPGPGRGIGNLTQVLRTDEEPKRLRRGYPTTCDQCGRATEVPFEPTPGRAKYCRECLVVVRAARRREPPAPAGARAEGTDRAPRADFPHPPLLPRGTERHDDGRDWNDPERA